MLFIVENWKSILAVVATAAICYLLHTVDVDRIEDAQRTALAAQVTSDKLECDKNKAISQGVSNGLQKSLNANRAALAAVKRLRVNACVAVRTAIATNGHDAAPSVAKLPDANGVNSDDLYGFASDAEADRLQLISCQSFITQTWAAVGQ